MTDKEKIEEIMEEMEQERNCEDIGSVNITRLKLLAMQAHSLGIQLGKEDERQFILNILDGIDIADEQMGNIGGGTKAIRLALQSRIITTPKEPLVDKKK